jgi:hypothetical protein
VPIPVAASPPPGRGSRVASWWLQGGFRGMGAPRVIGLGAFSPTGDQQSSGCAVAMADGVR